MGLLLSEAQEIVRTPRNKKSIEEASKQQSRVNLHTEPILELSLLKKSNAYNQFIAWVKKILTTDKYNRFTDLLVSPMPTVSLTDSIFTEFLKTFEAQDRNFDYEFTDISLKQDFNSYLEEIGDQRFFRTKGFEASKTGINSFLIVDMAESQTTSRPEPFYFIIDIDEIVDVDQDSDNNVKYIAYTIDEDTIGYIDDEVYRIFERVNSDWFLREGSEKRHGLGYTPARSFWTTPSASSSISKLSPVGESVSDLDWSIFFKTSKKHAELYAAFPIINTYESECNYRSDTEHCVDGFLTNTEKDITVIQDRETPARCPLCDLKNMLGAGTVNLVKPPKEGEADLIDSLKMVGAETDSLEYLSNELDRINKDIFFNATGVVEIGADQAKNERQIDSVFESRKEALMKYKLNIEIIHKFANDTVAILRYGNNFLGSIVDYGRQFFIFTAKQLEEEYDRKKKAGFPQEEIDEVYNQLIETKHRGNPIKIRKLRIIRNITPFPDKSLEEVVLLRKDGLIDEMDFQKSINLINFIKRFERENGPLSEFGVLIDFKTTIENINKTIDSYVKPRENDFGQPSAGTQD